MRAVIDSLQTLQKLTRDPSSGGDDRASRIEVLRRTIPPAVLVVFDSMINRGRTAIAAAAKGVCSGCHLQLSSGTVSGMQRPDSLERCDHCGRYLFLAEPTRPSLVGTTEERMPPGAATAPKKRTRRQKLTV